ncbi:GGDEF domain-containing protein [Paenibacillus yonginensis]|uniref:GGDEF domain-containing protein n=1 Tax=Paenibacillus yonginensis TaxID=1462996 RepID=UPI000B096658|nr:GGDEF domain-containing protein [Paenibacillus yonginensis]
MSEFFTPSALSLHRQSIWIRWFLRIYWIIIVLHDAAQLFAYWFLPYDITIRDFYMDILLYPTLMMGTAVVIAEMIHKWAPKYTFFSLFGAGAVLSLEIIHLNMDIRIITALLLLPIIASTIFFRIDLTLFTSVLQTGVFLGMYYGDAWFRTFLTGYDVIAVPLFLFVSTLVSTIIIISGRELVKDLELAQKEKRHIMRQSRKDAQTGLYNHSTFQHFFDTALEHGHQGEGFHLALLDIDNFKMVNDQYGHRAGDLILLNVSRIIRENLEPGDRAFRYGGEEFALLLYGKELDEAYTMLEAIRSKISSTDFKELGGKAVTVSIGLKSYSRGISRESLFEETDSLLYQAKRSGKNQIAM